MTRLSVNVDHVATLREARGTSYPDPVAAARLAEEAGALGITVHLRGDRRHIQTRDVSRLREVVQGKLNLEMAMTEEMVRIARETRPDQVTLVPERPEEVTTEGGLDLRTQGSRALEVAATLSASGIAVSLFVDPDFAQVDWLSRQGVSLMEGFEINTDRYARASGDQRDSELTQIQEVAELGAAHDFRVYAGHALTTDNVGPIAAVPQIEELNIGHFLVARAVLVGLRQAVGEMLAAIAASQVRARVG